MSFFLLRPPHSSSYFLRPRLSPHSFSYLLRPPFPPPTSSFLLLPPPSPTYSFCFISYLPNPIYPTLLHFQLLELSKLSKYTFCVIRMQISSTSSIVLMPCEGHEKFGHSNPLPWLHLFFSGNCEIFKRGVDLHGLMLTMTEIKTKYPCKNKTLFP